MASPEPQISTVLPLKESLVLEQDPLGTNSSWPRCVRVMDTGEELMLATQWIKTEANSPEAGDDAIAIEQESDLPKGPKRLKADYETCSETDQELPATQAVLEPTRSHWNIHEIFTKLLTPEQCIKFAEDRGLIPKKKSCSYHRRPMALSSDGQLGGFRCMKDRCHKKKVARAIGTCFENLRVPLSTVFQIMYMFSHQYSYTAVMRDTARDNGTMVSSVTIANWYAHCRETIIVYHLEHQEDGKKIGGPGKIVHIDQSKFVERKFNRSKHIEGQWVLGLMEKGNDDLRLELCPDNEESAKMLIPMIVQKHIEVGTEIHTNSWVAYHCLSDHGFVHKTDTSTTENGMEESEGIEPMDYNWRKLKALFKRQRFQGNFTNWLVEYSWRRKIKTLHKCPFEELLKAFEYVY